MIAIVVAAVLASGNTTASASPAPQSQVSAAPLREVVYHYRYDVKTTQLITDESGGDSEVPQMSSEYAGAEVDSPPGSTRDERGYNGTLIVDVLGTDILDGDIRAEVRDQANAQNATEPFEAVFAVHPDGKLTAISGKYDDDMLTLLPYFGSSYFGPHAPLRQGMSWTDSATLDTGDGSRVTLDTTTTVASAGAEEAKLTITSGATRVVQGMFSLEMSLLYDAAKSAPSNLDVRLTRRISGDSTGTEQIIHYHFDRVSDTLDKS